MKLSSSSSKTKDSSSSSLEGDGNSSNESLFGSSCDGFSDQKPEKSPPPPQPQKKQVRRRLHTSRPYQERLLNMAEARREIVTALKYHRAAMKKATERQQQQQQQQQQQMEITSQTQVFESSSHQFFLEQEDKLKFRRNPRIYASNSSIPDKFPNSYPDNFSQSPGFSSPYSWSISPIAPPPLPPVQENFNFTLPSQTLGLNLNLQDFNYLDPTFLCSANHSSIYSSPSPSTSSSPLSATTEEIPCMGPPASASEFGDSGLHAVMDDKEIAEIRSIGDQYQMEWDDTLNLVNSAWWLKFLKVMEITPENQCVQDFPFDEVMEFPAWLNANDGCLQYVNSDNYFKDPALPCMDIGEIEGMDGDWLA
ncbi:vacuolar protein-sorting-associated protein 36-like isoform X2 [Salvia splendens]|uniref:vacuolar protein-sorting-associated protein 36-like isoform X2 n=1 Tax=Salvia splendens TaxID=180675 RepID=UPI001C26D6BF|nr:vacuolar protein-sorting-associated protein 36-like isoform X2 [Salvia splendens]